MSEPIRAVERGEEELQELWERFKSSADPAAREGLILHYSALVKFVAGRLRAGLPRNVDAQDLISYGTFGLIDAIDKFDPERGYKFETYAVNRIKGAILDELRALDWVPRSVRARARLALRNTRRFPTRPTSRSTRTMCAPTLIAPAARAVSTSTRRTARFD